MLGAITGDLVGSVFEFCHYEREDFAPLIAPNAFFTDDTVLTVAVADAFLNRRDLVESLKEWGRRYPRSSWGGRFRLWLFSDERQPYFSLGNGAAMRCSPAAWPARDLDEALALARHSAEVTHNHPEGIKGAQATVMAIFLARQGLPAGEIRQEVAAFSGYRLNRSVEDIRPTYRFDETCPGSVPEALICALEADSFEQAVCAMPSAWAAMPTPRRPSPAPSQKRASAFRTTFAPKSCAACLPTFAPSLPHFPQRFLPLLRLPENTMDAAHARKPSVCLFAFIGTGKYERTRYRAACGDEHETAYCAAAIARLYGCARIFAFATEEARRIHGPVLSQELAGLIEWRTTPAGKSEVEIREIFEALRRQALDLPNETEIIFDITHGFRSQPFFVGALVQYLSAIEPGRIHHLRILYGAFEARENGVTPILDLTPYLEFVVLIHAISIFLATGHGEPLCELLDKIGRNLAREWAQTQQGPRPALDTLARRLRDLVAALDAVRIGALLLPHNGEDGLIRRILATIEMARASVGEHLPLLAEPLQRLGEQLAPLCVEQDHLGGKGAQPALAALARLYWAWGRLPEAAIVLREAWTCLLASPQAARPGEAFDEAARREADRSFTSAWPDIARRIAGFRNDIEHGGFRFRPLPADTIRQQIEEGIDEYANASLADRKDALRGRTWFVSRHSGAVEWAARQGLKVDQRVEHLDVNAIQPGDWVIGTLPVNLAAQVCARRARFFNLSLDLPAQARGKELSADDMVRYGARIEEYHVSPIANGSFHAAASLPTLPETKT